VVPLTGATSNTLFEALATWENQLALLERGK